MNKQAGFLSCVVVAWLLAVPAVAGNTTIDFGSNTGLLTYDYSGSGHLTSSQGQATFTGDNTTFLAQGGNPVTSGGSTSMTMTLWPAGGAGNGIGLVMQDAQDPTVQVTAIVTADGTVTLTDWIGNYQQAVFQWPNATNNSLTLTYDASLGRATLSLNGADVVFLEDALYGAVSVAVGVTSNGPGSFTGFTAAGSGIPNYTNVDTDHDGVADSDETAAGTNPNDPGNLPVQKSQGASITALNGAHVMILAGSLPAPTVNILVGAQLTVPAGNVPGGKIATPVALKLEPNGTNFNAPVMVVMHYNTQSVQTVRESTLEVFYFTGTDYSASGIVNLALDAVNHTVTFTTTHFTVFILAGTPSDSDGDGIDDLWEDHYFGNDNGIVEPSDLIAATASSNFDGDSMTDLEEYRARGLGVNPRVADGPLPVAGGIGIALLGGGLLAAALRRLRR